MLDVTNLNVFYGRVQVLTDVSLSIEEGEIIALIGSNGAGKTTLTRAVSGLISPASGHISFMGKRIDGKSPREIVEMGLVLVREGRGVFTNLTVKENLRMGAYTRKARGQISESMTRVKNLFPLLEERENQLAGTLSGGEQQMLALGRALMARPKLLILDEPSLGLAPLVVRKMFDILLEINREGVALLIADQNMTYTLKYADRGYVIETGRIVLSGESHSLMNNEDVKQSYLGL